MQSPIKCVTWNVNSVRARTERILAFLDAHQPDIACLQEIKCTESKFPFALLQERGYQAAVFGQPAYNGVAILASEHPTDVQIGLDGEARVIAGTALGVRWINVYVPNGQRVGAEKYEYKLRWLKHLRRFLVDQMKVVKDFVLMGDFNVILDDIDTAHPDKWEGTVLCDPITRERLATIQERWKLVDVLRKHAPGPGVYTWWDYRSRGFEWNDGVRIDHILATPGIAARSVNAWVDVEERGQERPSDHAPVLARILRPNGHQAK